MRESNDEVCCPFREGFFKCGGQQDGRRAPAPGHALSRASGMKDRVIHAAASILVVDAQFQVVSMVLFCFCSGMMVCISSPRPVAS
jgi:hypothetical protein